MKAQLIKILLQPVLIALAAIVLVFFTVSTIDKQVEAAPQAQFTTSKPLWRVLDTNGDGTGVTNAISSTTPLTFYIEPPAATVYNIERFQAVIDDLTVNADDAYGAETLTNGLVIRFTSAGTVYTLTNELPIKTNIGWERICQVEQSGETVQNNQLRATCDFLGRSLRLNGDSNDRLEVVVQDDLSGLDNHWFSVIGYTE